VPETISWPRPAQPPGCCCEPAVAAAWNRPRALPEFSVGGLAGHLAYQILAVQQALTGPAPQEQTISFLEHYGRVQWIGAGIDDEINVRFPIWFTGTERPCPRRQRQANPDWLREVCGCRSQISLRVDSDRAQAPDRWSMRAGRGRT
jgi:hypothetical protein